MAEPQFDEEENLVFNVEDIQKIVRDNIELCLGGNAYSHSRCPQWITVITEKTLARLNKLNKPFKYINTLSTLENIEVGKKWERMWKGIKERINRKRRENMGREREVGPGSLTHRTEHVRMTITQKNGAGLHTAAAYYWDTATDSTCTVRWENKFMYCIVNIWGLALQI